MRLNESVGSLSNGRKPASIIRENRLVLPTETCLENAKLVKFVTYGNRDDGSLLPDLIALSITGVSVNCSCGYLPLISADSVLS